MDKKAQCGDIGPRSGDYRVDLYHKNKSISYNVHYVNFRKTK